MKKKILTKHILMALAMAAMVPAGQAWAWEVSEDRETLVSSSDKNETLNLTAASPVPGTSLDQFTTIQINHTATKPQRDFAAEINGKGSVVDLKDTNFKITVDKNEENENADGLHITGNNTKVTIGDFSGAIHAAKSDGISIGNEAGGSNILNVGSIGQADGLIVDNGNGIRASAVSDKYVSDKTFTGYESVINVAGATNITINGEMIEKSAQVSSLTVSGKYAPAAVYAGDDMYYFIGFGNQSIGQGIISLNDTTLRILKGENNQGGYGLYAGKNGTIKVNGDLNIISDADNSYGIAAKDSNLVYGNTFKVGSWIEMPNLDTSANTHGTSVILGEGKDVSISMQGDNSYAMYAEGVDNKSTQVSISGEKLHTLYAEGDMLVENGGLIKLGTTGEKADDNGNSWGACQLGAVIASGTNKDEKSTYSLKSTYANYISSESIIDHAGDLDKTAEEGGLGENAPKINSALYAEHGGQIDLGGSFNYIAADYSGEGSESYSRRAVWAYDAADINITGGVQIVADDSAQDDPAGKNSTNMAIVAGTSTNVTSENVNNEISDRATVTVNYDSYAGSDGNTVVNSIKGDIVSAYAGQVDIRKKDDNAKNAKINITGNLLAGNNGILNVDLGNGGTLEGRADDYGDAGVIQGSEHTKFFDPAFSSAIYKGGAVNLTMGAGSTWKVTGQSWITSIDTNNAAKTEDVLEAEDPIKAMKDMATIDLVSANTDQNQYAHAMTIYKMQGDAVFNMSLDGDRDVSDMLYMKHADGSYIINVVDPVTLDDMYARRDNGELFNGLRFATVGKDSDVTFRAVTIDKGVLNVEYEVGTDSYDNNEENEEYNSTAEDGTASGNSEKPGDAMVDGFFESDGTPVGSADDTTSSANYMVLSETDAEADTQNTGATNYKLIGRADEEISSAGKAIVAMSKVNYSNAVYMDRLNKRMGEARYIDGDDGLWVRLRHDRIGREDAFRSMNTMFELGYDRKVRDQKDGEHRRGVAFDYMRGEADYTNVMGSGDVRRAGVWLYDTWLGDKGHYSDYVLKYGRLSNDFDIFSELGDKISGDYDNDVWSASAEYGRKKDIGNEWYFEPQAQLQYAYVTSADYTTSQNTKVSLDGIDSLIGRAGFRLGRDTSEGNTVYFKADILHEFLGDQRVHASDITGTLDTTYDNEGTWYDVGLGFSHRMGEDSYMFLDVEHSFGNDNEDTYQINIGLNRAF